MKSTIVLVTLLFVLSAVALIPTSLADEKIDVCGYFTWMGEDGSWHEWVNCSDEKNQDFLNLLSLKVGQPVKCKIKIMPHEKCTISFDLYEPGFTNAFDVLSGSSHKQSVAVMDDGSCKTGITTYDIVPSETECEYTWILKTNGNWTSGNAPLKAYWLGNFYQYAERSGWINFVNAYIINENWTGPEASIESIQDQNAPGFELFLIILTIVALVTFKKIG